MAGQFHLDADTYREMIRSEIRNYDDLQAELANATANISANFILDLGSGTGETALACMRHHPDAALVCVDSSVDMLDIARVQLPAATFIASRLEDELPVGPFDLVVSAFAIHHLDGEGKRDLFRRVAQVLSPEGCFAFLDVVVPTASVVDPIAIEDGVDKPSAVADMIHWLDEAGLQTDVVHMSGDLAILSASQTPQAKTRGVSGSGPLRR